MLTYVSRILTYAIPNRAGKTRQLYKKSKTNTGGILLL